MNRKGELLCNAIYWLAGEVASTNNYFVHSDNFQGDPNSLPDARLKTEVTPISGQPALDVLSHIQGCTYNSEDLDQRRVGLIAGEVEDAIGQLACDNIISSKWHNEAEYNTLDYSRLTAIICPALNEISRQVKDIQSKLNGSISKPNQNKPFNGTAKHN